MNATASMAHFGYRFLRALSVPILVLGLTISLAVTSVQAAEQGTTEEAAQTLKQFSDQAIAVLADSRLSDEEREQGLRKLIRASFEIDTIGRFVLGKHWRRATEAEKSEYRRLFENYIVVMSMQRLAAYSGETFVVSGARQQGKKGLVAVNSKIQRPQGGQVQVDWRLRKNQGAWKIVDVVFEGVSMAQVQRVEFDAVIRQSGGQIEALLAKLRQI